MKIQVAISISSVKIIINIVSAKLTEVVIMLIVLKFILFIQSCRLAFVWRFSWGDKFAILELSSILWLLENSRRTFGGSIPPLHTIQVTPCSGRALNSGVWQDELLALHKSIRSIHGAVFRCMDNAWAAKKMIEWRTFA